MNWLNLRQRLLLLTLLPSTLIALALMAFFTFSSVRTLEAELHSKGLATVRYLAPISEYGIIAGQVESLHSLAQATVQEPGVKAAFFVNQKGRTIAVSGRVSLAAETFRQPVNEPRLVTENDQWMAFGAPVVRSLNDTDTLFEPLDSAASTAPAEVIGHVFVELDKSELSRRRTELWQRGLLIFALGLVLISILAVGMADNLAKPLLRLVLAVRAMSAGRLDTRIAPLSPGEFGELEHGFNDMAEHIEEVHQSMQQRIEEATAQLAYQARHDPLTGLINRREFEQRLEKALAGVLAGGEECCILFIDLDRFKPVNDTCGHLAGDELLRQISQLFAGRLREGDTLARLGGDEFGVLLGNCTVQRARQVAEDLCALAGAYRFIWQDKVFAIGASIGLTPVTPHVRSIIDILAAGDAACYRAKEQGRNQICEQLAGKAEERRQDNSGWPERIAAALAERRLLVEALPIFPLRDMAPKIHLVEMLGRLSEAGRPAVSLAALIDTAERYDLAPAVDLYFLDAAMDALARTVNQRQGMVCLVPLSVASLCQRSTAEHIRNRLSEVRISGQGLCLLITEEAVIRHTAQALDFVRNVRQLGCQIALDDFGGGLSSFSHLRAIRPDYIKLSRSLTRDLTGSRASTALLRAVQEISTDLGIHTIANGIDDPAVVGELAELGISYAQGPAVAPNEPFEVWLEGVVLRST